MDVELVLEDKVFRLVGKQFWSILGAPWFIFWEGRVG